MSEENTYIEFRDGGYWVRGMRVSLDSVVYQWREGLSPETIRDCFPVLSLKQVYGTITYYLEHQVEIDEYLKQAEAEEEHIRQQIRAAYPEAARRVDELSRTALLRTK
jgi:uncharacterized protein (DUF433 family)